MDLLARREHSERELSRKLSSRGYAADVIEATLAGLIEDELLSNSRFTESFVHSRYQRGQGPQKIRAGLRERGIDDNTIDTCLDDYTGQWRELVASVRLKKFGAAMPANFRERSRQMRFLQQRGFTSEQIASAFHDDDA